MSISNQEKANHRELQVLRAIGLVGWLSATQVAKWVWSVENAHSARVSADKVLKRLMMKGEVLRRDSSLRMAVYILTKPGGLRANEGLARQLFRHGYDLSQLDSARQRPAVDYLIAQHHEGKIVIGLAGLRRAIEIGMVENKDIKGADGLVCDPNGKECKPILVIRNMHPELVKKAKRIKKAAGDIELIGSEGLIKLFNREMRN